jgi:DNA-binding NarL/FixJ family response regulator
MKRKSIRVLLIDDEPAHAWLVRDQLNSAAGSAVELIHVESLAEGIQKLADGGFDAVLLDLSLPDSYGADTFPSVRARFPRVPIVVLTSLEDQEYGDHLINAGAQDYLVKGQIDSRSLYRTVRHAVERQQLILELQEALAEVKTLSGLLPICSACKKIRDDRGYWTQIEQYIEKRSDAQFTHGICPDCVGRLYGELYENKPPTL